MEQLKEYLYGELRYSDRRDIKFLEKEVGKIENILVDKIAAQEKEKELKESGLVIKVMENLTDYLSCEIKLDEEMKSGYIRQPHLIASLKKSFAELVKSKQKYKTPGTPGQGVLRPETDEMKISAENQKIF